MYIEMISEQPCDTEDYFKIHLKIGNNYLNCNAISQYNRWALSSWCMNLKNRDIFVKTNLWTCKLSVTNISIHKSDHACVTHTCSRECLYVCPGYLHLVTELLTRVVLGTRVTEVCTVMDRDKWPGHFKPHRAEGKKQKLRKKPEENRS